MKSNVLELPSILIVDDNQDLLETLTAIFQESGFKVSVAANVNNALKCIASQTFDVLLSDLQMPAAGDGLTVVSAMRHSNPKAVTFIFSGFPEMNRATRAILDQADQILTKPMEVTKLVETVKERLRTGAPPVQRKEDVATILEHETQATIAEWLGRVDAEPEVISVKLTDAERSAHLPELFTDLVNRLRLPLPLGSRALISDAARHHGTLRRQQGYSPAMMVEESRMLQVCIFQTLQRNLQIVDFSVLLMDVMAIADECDSQLAQTMSSYIVAANKDSRLIEA